MDEFHETRSISEIYQNVTAAASDLKLSGLLPTNVSYKIPKTALKSDHSFRRN